MIIGCSGGFYQECTQPYSPSAGWMSEVDVALNDEGQQHGNLDFCHCKDSPQRPVVWCGDNKQTPGGLRKSYEAKAFLRKLMRRLIALRGDTKFILGETGLEDVYFEPFSGLQNGVLGRALWRNISYFQFDAWVRAC